MRLSFYEYCTEYGMGDLLEQWDSERNTPLTPRDLSHGSHRIVWWRCVRGHRWQAMVKSRAEGRSCPVCSSRRVLAGENDLASRFPAVAAQWHPVKNGNLTPDQVLEHSRLPVWWRCALGHEWRARIASRTQGGRGCPVCAGRVALAGFNDLAHQFPALAGEWDQEKNGALRADQLTAFSSRAVWWKCPLGHSYQAAVSSRTSRGSGCPYCMGRKVLAGFNDLQTTVPAVAAQWHPALNGVLTPEQVTAGSRKKVWWVCGEGHVWKAAVFSRAGSQRCGCPVCAGKGKQKNVRAAGG